MNTTPSFGEQERKLQKLMKGFNEIVEEQWRFNSPDYIAERLSRIYGIRLSARHVYNAMQANNAKNRKPMGVLVVSFEKNIDNVNSVL